MSDNQIYSDRRLKKYFNTLILIYVEAVMHIFPDAEVFIEYSVNKGLYTEIRPEFKLNFKIINQIKFEMMQLIESNQSIEKKCVSRHDAIDIFKHQRMNDKVKLLEGIDVESIEIFRINQRFYNIYGDVFDSTGEVDQFDLRITGNGIVLLFPRKEDNFDLPEYIHQENLFNVFREAERWAKLIGISNAGDLNQSISNKKINDIIRVSEALHEKKIAQIADTICEGKAKVILIAGPSSSGKTTFANRLGIQLMVNGKKFKTISLDNYFVDRELTPLDHNGNYDFDTIEAVDLELFNKDINRLLKGEEVRLPTFNFLIGKREYINPPSLMHDGEYIVIEGIHGLNPKLTKHIKKANVYKIYISALTPLNIDNQNRISTTDLRLIRRMIRDNQYRGHNATRTLELWENVVKGENKYIFPFQENADVMFNSSLLYELAVLKKYALPVINEIDGSERFRDDKNRLLEFLDYFKIIDDDTIIPNASIIKEFIGGGCYE